MNTNRRKRLAARIDPSLLAHIPPFSKLSIEQISEILDHAVSRRYDPGATIFEEGEYADRFYLLLDGYIRVVRTSAQGERVTALHIPSGQLFGIAKAIGRDTYPAAAVTATEAVALSWATEFWSEFVVKYDGFATETYKVVGNRLEEMSTRILELATQQVEQRVASALSRLINQVGQKVDRGIEINFPITRQDLSEITGTTTHTVSRMLSAWEKQGIIASKRKQITVLDSDQLALLCETKA